MVRTLHGFAAGLSFLFAAAAPAADFDLNGKRFHLVDDLTIELAAAAPLTFRPICVDFDEEGRLYVAESSGTNDNVQKQLAEKPHSILRLEDTDGDGIFDRRTVFADGMMFPEGCEWHDGSLYVGAPPQIWKLTDTDDDGVADRREVWFDGKTLTGCANDLHGPYTGPDGLLYWCKGAFAEQTHEQPGGAPFVTRASHIFRHDPTSGAVEPILTGGMDNPVEVAFTRDGEPILSCTFLQHPAGGLRDGLIHAVYGGTWGKDHRVLDGHPRTGDLMPPLVHLGAAAPCGLTRLESWGEEEILLACSFNMHKVTRHVLRPSGGTYATTDDDLLLCDDIDFHPTDVIEDADGSLLVVDTGGWYKLCCPTSQLHKPDVPGAIYRIRRASAEPSDDRRGLKLRWANAPPEDLVRRLADDRFAVRRRSVDELARHGAGVVSLLERTMTESDSADVRGLVLWTLSRINDAKAREVTRRAFGDPDASVKRVAIRSAGLWRDGEAGEVLRSSLEAADANTRRVAAEALARIGDRSAVPDLLAAAASAEGDRFLHHAVTFALLEIGDAGETRPGLASDEAGTVRAALLALDQIPDGGLSADEVLSRLDSKELRDTAEFLIERHPEWDGAVAGWLAGRLHAADFSEADRTGIQALVTRFAQRPAVRDLLAEVTVSAPTVAAREVALVAMAAPQKLLPARWTAALLAALGSGEPAIVRLAVQAASSAEKADGDADGLRRALRRVANGDGLDAEVRLRALRVASAGERLDDASFHFAEGQLVRGESVALRLLAADVLQAADLGAGHFVQLADLAAELGPMELDRLLPVFAKANDDATGLRLVEALGKSSAAADAVPEKLQIAFSKFGPRVSEAARPLLERPQADAEQRRATLESLLAGVGEGDPQRGHAIFQSSKAACSACHAVGYLGGRIGPDLSDIRKIRTDRDLLEAILFPNASFVRSYEPVVIVTKSGLVHSGVPRDESEDSITLVTAADRTVTISRDEIDEMSPGTVSIMPAGLEKQLSPQELADLIAFLKVAQ